MERNGPGLLARLNLLPKPQCLRCGHGTTRHCRYCGVCHQNQNGRGNPFLGWCGCIKETIPKAYFMFR